MSMCPGQDTRFWRPGDIYEIECGSCGNMIEFFKDEARRKCRNCGARVVNPQMSLGCAKWCEHAKECLGYDPNETEDPDQFEVSLADRLTEEMKRVFGEDQKRIDHALSVYGHAKDILKTVDADPRVVTAAAILHDIGIKEAEKKHGSSAGVYQEKEGPAIAEKILKELEMDKDTIEDVVYIIANHHSGKDIDKPEFNVVWDADWLVNLPEVYEQAGPEDLERKIDRIFKTDRGKEKAYELYGQEKKKAANGDL